jgi:hypothetical protein
MDSIRRFASSIAAAVLFCVSASAAEQREITVAEASELVTELLKPDGWTKLPGFVLYQALFDAQFQGFYFIHAEWDSPASRHVAIGHFAVERSTGEVWDWVRCGQFNSPSLTAAQAAMRKRIGLDDSDYKRIRKPGPFCAADEKPQAFKMGRPKKK